MKRKITGRRGRFSLGAPSTHEDDDRMEPLHHTKQWQRGIVLSAVLALALAALAGAPAATPAAKPAPTLHDVQLDGVATAWSGVSGPLGGASACKEMTVTNEGRVLGFGERPKRGRFTSTTTVTFGPIDRSDPFGSRPVADLSSTIEIKTGPRRAVVTLSLGAHEVIGQCVISPGGESGRASGTVDYTATITGPHHTIHESGTATIAISAGQGHAPTDRLGGSVHVQFD